MKLPSTFLAIGIMVLKIYVCSIHNKTFTMFFGTRYITLNRELVEKLSFSFLNIQMRSQLQDLEKKHKN